MKEVAVRAMRGQHQRVGVKASTATNYKRSCCVVVLRSRCELGIVRTEAYGTRDAVATNMTSAEVHTQSKTMGRGELSRELARLKAEYEHAHPELRRAKHGERADAIRRYSLVAAELTGLGERAVQRHVRLGLGASDEVVAAVDAGTMSMSQALKRLPPKQTRAGSGWDAYVAARRAFLRQFEKLKQHAMVVGEGHRDDLAKSFRWTRSLLVNGGFLTALGSSIDDLSRYIFEEEAPDVVDTPPGSKQ